MAVSDSTGSTTGGPAGGGGVTELLSGWNFVVHRPSEDPEPSSLPSTVDMAAFSAGPGPSDQHNSNNTAEQDDDATDTESDSGSDTDNSASEASGSCSLSSSDSDSSSSSQCSSSRATPPSQFSVTSMQTGGLKLKIAAVRKSCDSPIPDKDDKQMNRRGAKQNSSNRSTGVASAKEASSDSDSDSDCSSDSSSDDTESQSTTAKSDTSELKPVKKIANKNAKCQPVQNDTKTGSGFVSKGEVKRGSAKQVKNEKAVQQVTKSRPPPTRARGRQTSRMQKASAIPATSGRGSSVGSVHHLSSDTSDDEVLAPVRPPNTVRDTGVGATAIAADEEDSHGAMLASCSLQEIRQEDLAAILPDQQDDCDADASGSDMELPPQLVSAAIQRATECASELEEEEPCTAQPLLYANSLLQQFEVQTQMLSTTPAHSNATALTSPPSHLTVPQTAGSSVPSTDESMHAATLNAGKKKRGRPKKQLKKPIPAKSNDSTDAKNNNFNPEYCGEPNVSPDSGIQESPERLSSPEPSPVPRNKNKSEHSERHRTRSASSDKNKKHSTKNDKNDLAKQSSKSEKVEKAHTSLERAGIAKLKQGDKNKHSFVRHNLDRVLYASTDRVLYPPRRKVRRPSVNVKPMPKRPPGRPPKQRRPTHNEIDIAVEEKADVSSKQNVLTDGETNKTSPHSLEKSNESHKKSLLKSKSKNKHCKKLHRKNKISDRDLLQLTSNTLSLNLGKSLETQQRRNGETKENHVIQQSKKSGGRSSGALLTEICERVSKRLELTKKNVGGEEKVLLTKGTKNSKHDGSKYKSDVKLLTKHQRLTYSTHTRLVHSKHKHDHKKHRKLHRHNAKHVQTNKAVILDPKFMSEIDKLISDFVKYCNIDTNRLGSEKVPEIFKCAKRISKKRKGSDNADGRKKKKQCGSTNREENKEPSCNEQRLPLKKRHYHMSSGEHRQINASASSVDSIRTAENSDAEVSSLNTTPIKNPTENKKIVTVIPVPKQSACVSSQVIKSLPIVNNSKPSVITQTLVQKTNTSQITNTKQTSTPIAISSKSVSIGLKQVNNTQNNVGIPKSVNMLNVKILEKIKTAKEGAKGIGDMDDAIVKSDVETAVNDISDNVIVKSEIASVMIKSKTSINDLNCTLKIPKVPLESELTNIKSNSKNVELFRTHIQEAIEACITRYSSPITVPSDENSSTDKPKVEIAPVKPEISEVKSTHLKNMTTTPKKRHRLEAETLIEKRDITKIMKNIDQQLNLPVPEKPKEIINEPKVDVSSTNNNDISLNNKDKAVSGTDKKTKISETIAQIKTRKKNRLEDLTSNLVSKIIPIAEALDDRKSVNKNKVEVKSDTALNRATVIKSPITRKVKPAESEKLSDLDGNIVSDKPTGIFLPTVDVELEIPAMTILNTSFAGDKSETKPAETAKESSQEQLHNLRKNKKVSDSSKNENIKVVKTESKKKKECSDLKDVRVQVEKIVETVTKNKKVEIEKQVTVPLNKTLPSVKSNDENKKRIRRRKAINRTGFPTLKKKKKKIVPVVAEDNTGFEKSVTNDKAFERIPRLDEEPSTFVERTQKSGINMTTLENKQTRNKTANDALESTKLVQDADTKTNRSSLAELKRENILSSKLDRAHESFRARQDTSPANSAELRPKRKVREISPSEKPSVEVELKASERIRRKIRDRSNESIESSEVSISISEKVKNKRKREVGLYDQIEKRTRRNEESYVNKKRIRDISPASSVDPLPSDKRIRSDDATSASGDETRRSRKPPRWRKKYLIAGLFSDYYKEDDESTRTSRSENVSKGRVVYKPEEHPHGLLPPPYHCGKWLRCRKTHFQLPHDLWWQHTHGRLPGRDLVPSWNYRKIRTNVYGSRPIAGTCEPQPCSCTPTSGCGDDCINRLVLAECPAACPAAHRCRNQRIQRHEWAPALDRFMTEDKGWGVRTKMPIKSGEFILEYVGEVVSDKEFKHRMATRYAHDTHHYCLHLDGGLVIDGHRMGGDGRFVNHSCQPNCEMQKWSVNGQFRMALFALRDIEGGEELTYDYNFSLFNPADGQECKCGSTNCRGVIGGKSQRVRQPVNLNQDPPVEKVPGRVGRPRKNRARRTTSGSTKDSVSDKSVTSEKSSSSHATVTVASCAIVPQVKPMNNQQKAFVAEHHCFLLKNLDKVRRIRERSASMVSRVQQQTSSASGSGSDTGAAVSAAILSQLNALRQPRNVRTRRLAQAEDDPELNRTAKLAAVFRDLCTAVSQAKDEKNEQLCAPFTTLPSKRKLAEYYQRISEPIDLSTIEQNVDNGVYRSVEAFDADVNKLLDNSVRFFGRTSEHGIAATRLRKVYGQAKLQNLARLIDILGEKPPAGFVTSKDPGAEEEDVIRCICGLYRDEGLMIQCERCLVWQHCECVKADAATPSYHCERCNPRKFDPEIPLDEYTEHGHQYYLTLMRGDLQLRQGDTVYVLRDIPIDDSSGRKHTYETIGDIEFTELDIFRIERLWKDKDTGHRMAYGHHYLRPHETYHEPTRRFFPNEVMRVPLYEVVPVELVMSRCWVLDLNTYCKGRPVGAPEEHIYICEYRVDKSARLFAKVSPRSHYPVCQKSYAFEKFPQRLKISRTYAPHQLENMPIKPRGKRAMPTDVKETNLSVIRVPIVRTLSEQKTRLNSILLKLLAKMPTKQPLDVSYLLEGGRRRKKTQS